MGDTVLEPSVAGSNGYHGRHPPASGSIRARLIQNCTTRLFVHPLEWTADHLEVLDVDLTISASTGEPVVNNIKRQVDEDTQLLGALWDVEHARGTSRDTATRQLVKSTAHATELQQQDVIESTLFLEYDNRHIARLPPLIVAWHQATGGEYSMIPIWAYTDHLWTSAARRKRFTTRKKSWSFAIKEINNKQGLAIDPVYVAILIKLGQLRRKHGLQGSKLHPVTLFVPEHESVVNTTTPGSSTTILRPRPSKQTVTKLVQYRAEIPSDYLQKFEEPYKFYNATLHIEKRTLPTNEPAIILQAMKAAFHDLDGCLKGPLTVNSKRKTFEELDLNVKDPKSETKRRKVCSPSNLHDVNSNIRS